jgi:hypothetical protein
VLKTSPATLMQRLRKKRSISNRQKPFLRDNLLN